MINPGLVITAAIAGGYTYWRFTFRQVTAAIRLEGAGRLDEARDLLNGFLLNPNPLTRRGEAKARGRLLLARLERKSGRYGQAAKESLRLENSLASPGLRLAALQVRADALCWAGDLPAALRLAREGLGQARDLHLDAFLPELEALQTRALLWTGSFDAATGAAEGLIRSGGVGARYGRLRLSEIERAAGRFDAAIEWAEKLASSLQVDAAQPGSRSDRMPLWESLARYHAARAAFLREDWSDAADRLVPENPLMPRAELVAWHGLRAATLAAIGKQNDADRALRRLKDTASAVPPGFGAAAWQRYYSGRAAMARGDYARAAEEIAAALQNFPPGDAIAEIWYFLGSCQEKAALGIARDAFASGAEYPASFHFARLCKAALNAGDSIPFIRLTAP